MVSRQYLVVVQDKLLHGEGNHTAVLHLLSPAYLAEAFIRVEGGKVPGNKQQHR